MKRTGFTLVEVMIVVSIFGLLMAIAIPSFLCARDTARLQKLGLERMKQSRVVIDPITKEVVEVNEDATAIIKRVGKIKCQISIFKTLDASASLEQIERYDSYIVDNLEPTKKIRTLDELLNRKPETTTPITITISEEEIIFNGKRYKRIDS